MTATWQHDRQIVAVAFYHAVFISNMQNEIWVWPTKSVAPRYTTVICMCSVSHTLNYLRKTWQTFKSFLILKLTVYDCWVCEIVLVVVPFGPSMTMTIKCCKQSRLLSIINMRWSHPVDNISGVTKAQYALATKLNSTRSTLLKVECCWNRQQIGNKVHCCHIRLTLLQIRSTLLPVLATNLQQRESDSFSRSTLLPIRSNLLPIRSTLLQVCMGPKRHGQLSRLSTKSTVLTSTLSLLFTGLY